MVNPRFHFKNCSFRFNSPQFNEKNTTFSYCDISAKPLESQCPLVNKHPNLFQNAMNNPISLYEMAKTINIIGAVQISCSTFDVRFVTTHDRNLIDILVLVNDRLLNTDKIQSELITPIKITDDKINNRNLDDFIVPEDASARV